MFLVNSRFPLVSATLTAPHSQCFTARAPLIPKLRGHFAEFLHHDSLDRLGILYQSTCVGLGYGRLTPRSRSFSRQYRITHSPAHSGLAIMPRPHAQRIYLPDSPRIWPQTTIAGVELPPCVPPQLAYYMIGSHTHHQPEHSKSVPTGARALSITHLGTDGATPVPEYQLVVHRLRLSASP